MFLKKQGIDIKAYVSQVGYLKVVESYKKLDLSQIEATPVRCPDLQMAKEMIQLIKKIRKKGDTIGGLVSAVIQGCPVGLGEPVFDKLHAEVGKAMWSIPISTSFLRI